MKTRYQCPCCGFLTLRAEPPGSYEICSVCFWEDDGSQLDDPTFRDGANGVSLEEARRNYKTFGACTPGERVHVRPPLPEEIPK